MRPGLCPLVGGVAVRGGCGGVGYWVYGEWQLSAPHEVGLMGPLTSVLSQVINSMGGALAAGDNGEKVSKRSL